MVDDFSVLYLVYTCFNRESPMQAELEKVSSLLDAATKSFRANVEEEGCTKLSEAAAILEAMIAKEAEPALAEYPRSRSAAA
jgi:hypothetical protein